jgi:hypothetical protein
MVEEYMPCAGKTREAGEDVQALVEVGLSGLTPGVKRVRPGWSIRRTEARIREERICSAQCGFMGFPIVSAK